LHIQLICLWKVSEFTFEAKTVRFSIAPNTISRIRHCFFTPGKVRKLNKTGRLYFTKWVWTGDAKHILVPRKVARFKGTNTIYVYL